MFGLATAFVGFEAAVALNDFVANYSWQVTAEDILDHGKIDKTVNWGINDHCAMLEKFSAKGCFKVLLSDNQIQNLADYFVSMPPEVGMKLWTSIGQPDGEDMIKNMTRLHAATSSNGVKIDGYLVRLLRNSS